MEIRIKADIQQINGKAGILTVAVDSPSPRTDSMCSYLSLSMDLLGRVQVVERKCQGWGHVIVENVTRLWNRKRGTDGLFFFSLVWPTLLSFIVDLCFHVPILPILVSVCLKELILASNDGSKSKAFAVQAQQCRSLESEVSPHPESFISFLFSFPLGDSGVEVDVPFRVE